MKLPRYLSNPVAKKFWYFSQFNESGGEYDRFGPFSDKVTANYIRSRFQMLRPDWRLGTVFSSEERYPSNYPHWMR